MSNIACSKTTCLPARPSLLDTFEQVKIQVEYHTFADLKLRYIDRFYDDLCLIIAEVLVMNPNSSIKINGSFLDTCLVQEVYAGLRSENVRYVYDNFQIYGNQVYNKKAYLRTALYNSFFEMSAHCFC